MYRKRGYRGGGRDMDRSSGTQLVQRLWSEHKYALIARSPSRARELGRKLAVDGSSLGFAADAIEDLMRGPEEHLQEALSEAWEHLQPRVGMAARRAVDSLLEHDPETARWLMGGLAEIAGDGVVASSRLLDHPAASRRIWLRDAAGPTMFEVLPEGPRRIPPAEVGRMLRDAHGEQAWRTLQLVAERPRSPSEMERLVGPSARRTLEAGHRILMLRRVGGLYRSRGTAVQLVLAGLGR
ncbi:MAG: hypothetical protein ACOC0J_00790 [Myxococcota bacterium]